MQPLSVAYERMHGEACYLPLFPQRGKFFPATVMEKISGICVLCSIRTV